MRVPRKIRPDQIPLTDRPPPGKPPFIPIISPKPTLPIRAIILGRRLYGVFTHFLDGKTRPCLTGFSPCYSCRKRVPKRWKGYLGVILPGSGRRAIAEITAEACLRNPGLYPGSTPLRGNVLDLRRSGKAANSPVACEIQTSCAYSAVPPEFDVMEALCRIWQLDCWFPSGDPGDPCIDSNGEAGEE